MQFLNKKIVIKSGRINALIKRLRGGENQNEKSFLNRLNDGGIRLAILCSYFIKPTELPMLIAVALSVLISYVAGTGELRGGVDFIHNQIGVPWHVVITALLGCSFITLKDWHPVLSALGVVPIILFSFGFGLGFGTGYYGPGAGFAFIGFFGLGLAMANTILIDFRLKMEAKARTRAEVALFKAESGIERLEKEVHKGAA